MVNKLPKRLIILGLFFISFFTIFFFINKQKKYVTDTIIYNLEGNKLNLLVADTPAEWEKGLMNYRKPVNFDGMVFVFPERQARTFWNKNTYVNLKLYWIDKEKIIGISDLPSIETTKEMVTVSSPGPADKVIEVIN